MTEAYKGIRVSQMVDATVIHPRRGIEHTKAMPGSHLGRRIRFRDMSQGMQQIIQDELNLNRMLTPCTAIKNE